MSNLLGPTQKDVLVVLDMADNVRTVDQLTSDIQVRYGTTLSHQAVRKALRRLEDRFMVRRVSAFRPTKWELTALGQQAAKRLV